MEALLLLVAAGSAAAYVLANRGKNNAEWRPVLEEAARSLEGRTSFGGMFDEPELRAEQDGRTVTVRLKNLQRPPAHRIAVADLVLDPGAPSARIYLGWGVTRLPPDLHYIPEVGSEGWSEMQGNLQIRADDVELARSFVDAAARDLVDLRRSMRATAIEVLVRSGTLKLAVHGPTPSAPAVRELVGLSLALARLLAGQKSSAETAPTAPMTPAAATPRCALCGSEAKLGDEWLACKRCRSPYHRACWITATGCVTEGCAETRADPI
jgi:hypothetical protein